MSMRFEGGFSGISDDFERDVDREIGHAKRGFIAAVKRFAGVVRTNAPVGPPKRKTGSGFYEGMLRDSVESETDTSGDVVTGGVSVGNEAVDYLWYINADMIARGDDFFAGADVAEREIDRAIRGDFDT